MLLPLTIVGTVSEVIAKLDSIAVFGWTKLALVPHDRRCLGRVLSPLDTFDRHYQMNAIVELRIHRTTM